MKGQIIKIVITYIIILGMAANVWAASYSGSLKAMDSTLNYGGNWGDAVFAWTVDNDSNPGYWTYDYQWATSQKDLSHLDIEVSNTFTMADLVSWTSNVTATVEGPQMLDEDYGRIYGLKWDIGKDTTSFHLTLLSTRMPMWGDIYAKDGRYEDHDVYAMNSLFGSDSAAAIGDGNNGGFALIPNTVVPIPSALLLLASGLMALLGTRMKNCV